MGDTLADVMASPILVYSFAEGFLWTFPRAIMAPEGVTEMPRESTATDSCDRGRFSARRETESVLRLLRGEDLDALSRELGVTAATPSGWRDGFLDGGTAAMKSRPADGRDEEIARLRSKVGRLTMDDELLGTKCQHLEAGRPFATRRRSG
jgi:hypothetical protein